MRVASKIWRHVPAGPQGLHVGSILQARNRQNRRGMYGALIAALTPEGAVAEYREVLRQSNGCAPGSKFREYPPGHVRSGLG